MPRIQITQQHLDSACARLNLMTGNPTTRGCMRPDGSLQSQVGHYHIEAAYGGWKLVQTMNQYGGVREPLGCGYTSRRDLLNLIHAMIAGVEAVQEKMEISAVVA